MRRIPLIPTIFVAAAAATMVALGVWQLQRKAWKEDLIARYARAEAMSINVPFPKEGEPIEAALFRHTSVDCVAVGERAAVSGRNANGESGWAHVAQCGLADGGHTEVAYGWSRNPAPVPFDGGKVNGVIAPVGSGLRIIADTPADGLDALARPDPADIPNNHLAYAVQWFLFAAAALIIYGLALRGRARRMGA